MKEDFAIVLNTTQDLVEDPGFSLTIGLFAKIQESKLSLSSLGYDVIGNIRDFDSLFHRSNRCTPTFIFKEIS